MHGVVLSGLLLDTSATFVPFPRPFVSQSSHRLRRRPQNDVTGVVQHPRPMDAPSLQDSSGLGRPSAMRGAMWEELSAIDRRKDWAQLRDSFMNMIEGWFSAWIASDEANFDDQLAFALGRFDEGAALLRYFAIYSDFRECAEVNVLDLGSGNGGVALALANCPRYKVHTVDIVPNPHLRTLRKRLGMSLHSVVGTAHHLAFSSNAFDVVLILDTIEHIPAPKRMGREIMRILKPGGVCMVTTPPRLRYLFRPDPHFEIPGLLLLPNALQRQIVDRIYRRRILTPEGKRVRAYDVVHMFWHVREISRLFPAPKRVDVLYDSPLTLGSRYSRDWWRYRFREFFWDRILIYKQ